MWTDNETTDDLTGSGVHADLIRGIVLDESLLPTTIGLFGDWGSGKTSILRMIERDLNSEQWPEGAPEREACEGVACLYFNGWLFEGYDDAKAAILSAVLLSLAEHRRFGPKVKEGAVRLLKSVNWMRVAQLGFKHVAVPLVAAAATGGAAALPALGGQLAATAALEGAPDLSDLIRQEEFQPGPLDIRSFRVAFAKLLRDSNIQSLVVLVDDLDRCSPERLIENLEAVKLFLNVEKTAFIVGADPRIVRQAIALRYSGYEEAGHDASGNSGGRLVDDYLEKLIQIPYRLPRLSPAEVQTYMTLLFCRLRLGKSEESTVKAIGSACAEKRGRDRYSTFGAGDVQQILTQANLPPAVVEPLLADLQFCSSIAPLITESLKGNPRQVKRFLNALRLRKQLADVAKLTDLRDDVLVKLMVLEHHDISGKHFLQVSGWQSAQAGHPRELESLERAARASEAEEGETPPDDDCPENAPTAKTGSADTTAEWDTPFLQAWLRMEPALTGVDLRDYFWVARDRLGSTLSGVTMVPPAVRRVAEQLLGTPGARNDAAVKALGLDTEERASLMSLLQQNILRRPDEKVCFDALRVLIEKGLAGSVAAMAQALMEGKASRFPPAVGADLVSLVKMKPEIKSQLDFAMKRLAGTDTKIGRAMDPTKKSVRSKRGNVG